MLRQYYNTENELCYCRERYYASSEMVKTLWIKTQAKKK